MNLLSLLEDVIASAFGPTGLARARAVASEGDRAADATAKTLTLAAAAAESSGQGMQATYVVLAEGLAGRMVQAQPALLRSHSGTLALLMHVNQVAPAALDAVLPGVTAPEFDVELLGTEAIRLRFLGSEALTGVIEGLALGLGRHYGEVVTCTWPTVLSTIPNRRVAEITVRPERRVVPDRRATPGSVPADARTERRWGGRNRGSR